MHASNQFRLQSNTAPVGANYLSIPAQWGAVAQPQPPSLPPAQVASATITANQPASAHAPNPSPRRTLTDADRRRMCLFHEENPNVKQTEIGAMFGVERSTVSKVLRQKEKYLYPDDGSRSPVKRSKGKFPDIERALSVWAKNANKKGMGLTDKMIWDRARLFATSIGISESHFKANSQGWLEKFKQKNNLTARADSDGSPMGRARSVSSVDMMASPMAMSRSQDSHYTATQHDSPDSFLEWGNNGGNYKHAGLSSVNSSMSSMFTDHSTVTSPTSPFYTPEGHRIDSGRPSPNGMGPSKDDARRALELVMTYLRQQPVGILLEPDEYLSMTKLLGRFGLDGPEGEHTAMLGMSS
ncbi:hypothetical protein DFH27DRAFT_530011 [Peziza echinospora]|nr:hypothetical protein DFH27DRAFT_530011 [Peziza echinospora]